MSNYIDDDNLWKEDLFETLGVPYDVEEGALKKAYLKLAKKYHPDKYTEENEEKLEAQRIFSKITVAYNTLNDPNKKKHYLELRRLLASHLPENQNIAPSQQNEETKPVTQSNSNNSEHSEPKKQDIPPQHSAEKLREEQARSLFDMGLKSLKKNDVENAIEQFKKAISTKPEIAEFHTQLGIAYKKKNWSGMAVNEFKLALKYNSKDTVAKKHLDELGDGSSGAKKTEKKGSFFSSLFNFGKKK